MIHNSDLLPNSWVTSLGTFFGAVFSLHQASALVTGPQLLVIAVQGIIGGAAGALGAQLIKLTFTQLVKWTSKKQG